MRNRRIVRVEKDSLYLDQFQLLDVSGFSIWLNPQKSGSVAFFNSCAHKGGELTFNGQFICSQHGWTYSSDGSNKFIGAPGLQSVNIKDETSEYIDLWLPSRPSHTLTNPPKDLVIKVLSHACLLLEYNGFKLLIDPWLFGNAYYDSWKLYPEAKLSDFDVEADAIIITHPHPDHFHLQTLQQLKSQIPVFFPNFQSRIIEDGLNQINRINCFEVPWRESYSFNENISFQFLQPRSLWEDSALFICIEDTNFTFNWLNLVDAGAALWEHNLPKIDLMTSAFNQGASGYPLTWGHLDDSKKTSILNEQKRNTLELLPKRCRELNVKYFLPFAGHWRLAQPEHRKYNEMIPQTTLDEVEQSFQLCLSPTKVLKVSPGKEYNFKTKILSTFAPEQFQSHADEEKRELGDSNSEIDFTKFISKFESYMNQLVEESEFFGVEFVNFTVIVDTQKYQKTFSFVSSESSTSESIQVSVTIPERLFCLLAEGKANWDHVSIGYWGLWNRSPNRYPVNFMRLLQIGKSKFNVKSVSTKSVNEDLILQKTIGDLIEINPKAVGSILNRAGLPCGACLRTNTETLESALSLHDIDIKSASWITRELRTIIH
jgi:CMP-N-acetylneuraminate monooxygenase